MENIKEIVHGKTLEKTTIFNSAILKIASRCNLNCDYCYVYQHADQSWKNQPKYMSKETIEVFAIRLKDYTEFLDIKEFSIIFHGGEPLLFGAEKISNAANLIRDKVGNNCKLSFSIQTNGTLVDEDTVSILSESAIGISLSLDGPKTANDLHRKDHAGNSSFNSVENALKILSQSQGETFLGVISVIDPTIPAKVLFDFFAPYLPPQIDFLLPDATHISPPLGRDLKPNLYIDWLTDAFEVWFTKFNYLKVRWFDSLLATRLGLPSTTDIMGFGNVSLIVIDTDGSYTDHDVFKIVGGSMSGPIDSVNNASFFEIQNSTAIKKHSYLLTEAGIAEECRRCPAVQACAGGCVMHRYHDTSGFITPSIYCKEIYKLLSVSSRLLRGSLSSISVQEKIKNGNLLITDSKLLKKCMAWSKETFLLAGIDRDEWVKNPSISSPAANILCSEINIKNSLVECAFNWMGEIRINSMDPRLTQPFLDSVLSVCTGTQQSDYFLSQLEAIEHFICTFSINVLNSIKALISDIIIVNTNSEHESGIFSFSDDTAPNVLYISTFVKEQPIPPEDLADSILHEFFHQVLYHHIKDGDMLYDNVNPMFPAPWRGGMRPSSGFLHGTFVFSWLSKFWEALDREDLKSIPKGKAKQNAKIFDNQAKYGIQSLQDLGLLTPRGINLIEGLRELLDMPKNTKNLPGTTYYGQY